MAPIPLTMIGIVPGHWLLGADFTATSMIGFIALAGIIVRNSILLVEFAREKVAEGMSVQEAITLAGRVRLRPILITALALVIGSMVLLSDPIFQGMAVSLLFGSLVATFLTLVVIPLGCVSARKYFHGRPPQRRLARPGGAAQPERPHASPRRAALAALRATAGPRPTRRRDGRRASCARPSRKRRSAGSPCPASATPRRAGRRASCARAKASRPSRAPTPAEPAVVPGVRRASFARAKPRPSPRRPSRTRRPPRRAGRRALLRKNEAEAADCGRRAPGEAAASGESAPRRQGAAGRAAGGTPQRPCGRRGGSRRGARTERRQRGGDKRFGRRLGMTRIRCFGLVLAAAALVSAARRTSASFGDLSAGESGSQVTDAGRIRRPYAAGTLRRRSLWRPALGIWPGWPYTRRRPAYRRLPGCGSQPPRQADRKARCRRSRPHRRIDHARRCPRSPTPYLPFGPTPISPHGAVAARDVRSGQFDDGPLQSMGSEHAFHVCAVEHAAIGVGQCADMELVAGAIRRPAAQLVGPRRCGPSPGMRSGQ